MIKIVHRSILHGTLSKLRLVEMGLLMLLTHPLKHRLVADQKDLLMFLADLLFLIPHLSLFLNGA